MRYLLFFAFFLPWITSCQNDEAGRKSAIEGDETFFDYQVSAEEGRAEATVRLQYKKGDENGEAITLEKPAKVLFDGTELEPDSSRFSGTYYEVLKPVPELSGRHSIVFVDRDGGEHKAEFSFQPFSLAEELPEQLPQKPFVIHLKDLPLSPTLVRVVMTDTSLQSAGVNEELLVEEGNLAIDTSLLDNLMEGPVTLEISREEIQPIQSGRGERGRLLLIYALRRQFNLMR
jgi:hypothetical protein